MYSHLVIKLLRITDLLLILGFSVLLSLNFSTWGEEYGSLGRLLSYEDTPFSGDVYGIIFLILALTTIVLITNYRKKKISVIALAYLVLITYSFWYLSFNTNCFSYSHENFCTANIYINIPWAILILHLGIFSLLFRQIHRGNKKLLLGLLMLTINLLLVGYFTLFGTINRPTAICPENQLPGPCDTFKGFLVR
jgi:hypothetical protein